MDEAKKVQLAAEALVELNDVDSPEKMGELAKQVADVIREHVGHAVEEKIVDLAGLTDEAIASKQMNAIGLFLEGFKAMWQQQWRTADALEAIALMQYAHTAGTHERHASLADDERAELKRLMRSMIPNENELKPGTKE